MLRNPSDSAAAFPISRGMVISFGLLVLILTTVVPLSVHFLGCKCEQYDRSSSSVLAEVAEGDRLSIGAMTPKLLLDKSVRLPATLFPRSYTVRLLPWMVEGNFTTDGRVQIAMDCVQNTTKIVLHSVDLFIRRASVRVVDGDGEELRIGSFEEDAIRQFFIIHLEGSRGLVQGIRYVLTMDFTGILNDQNRGFYRSSYIENGVKKYIAASQMEPVDARRAFPCFDEPRFKANFSIVLGRKKGMLSLSNMPKMYTTPVEGIADYEWDFFEPSVPMSSYLVAMVIADYSYVEAPIEGNVTFRLWARHSAINQTQYGLEVGPKMLQFYQEYFGIDYPLPKQDMVGIPDFLGAMENWGLILYGEQHLLYDPEVPSDSHRESVAQVIAHEQAHQWFGNLVTMVWSDLWLNEGFASYMSYLAAHHFEPSYQLCQQFVINELQAVMVTDSLATSHPINQPVDHPDEIGQIFDRISYNKGATIIRMLAEFLGENVFRQGLSFYLRSHLYANALQDDLWAALTHQADIHSVHLPADIKTIMDSWTLKMGYPVVHVTRNYTSNVMVAHQERFLFDYRTSGGEYLWWIPLTYAFETDPDFVHSHWMTDQTREIDITVPANEDQWIIVNVDQVGYYRVNYDDRNWNHITKQLLNDPCKISTINRAQLIDDAFNLARAGLLDYAIALNVTRYLEHELEYVPWKATGIVLKFIDQMLSRTPAYGGFQKYVVRLVDGLYHHANRVVPNDPLRAYTRTIAWRLACHFQHRDCLRNAVKLYANWMEHPERQIIPAPLKAIAACTAIAQGGRKEWEFAEMIFKNSNLATEKDDMLEAMTCSHEAWIITKMLDWTLDGTLGKIDAINLFAHLVRNPLGRYMTFDFFKTNWESIVDNYRAGSSMLASLLDLATESFNTLVEMEQLRQLFGDKYRSRIYDQVFERINANILWMARNNATISVWLQDEAKIVADGLTIKSDSASKS